ncbi:MAG: RIP metalloprotease [Oscillospiraceae bacterium]
MYIVLAIVFFGILIATHELGHFAAAKACNVQVNEFAIGMGPVLLKKQKGETLYSLRLLPIGGFCAMEGEDEASSNPRSFTKQSAWKRLIILAAGAAMNFVIGLIIIIVIFSDSAAYGGTTIVGFTPGFPGQGEEGLMAGDRIVEINGSHIFYSADFSTYMARSNGEAVDLVIVRDGQKVVLNDFPLTLREYEQGGETVTRYGISFNRIQASIGEDLKYSFYTSYNFIRLVWMGLSDLVTGAVGIRELSGPVGIVSVMSQVGEAAGSTIDALYNIAYLAAFIAVNLAVVNLLPIPALDGGRIFFLFITYIAEKLTRRHINPKYEGYVHAAGLVLLLGLMAFVMVNDIIRIITG